jgi:hypothetical protein
VEQRAVIFAQNSRVLGIPKVRRTEVEIDVPMWAHVGERRELAFRAQHEAFYFIATATKPENSRFARLKRRNARDEDAQHA